MTYKLYHSCAELPTKIGDHPYFEQFMFFTGQPQRERGGKCFVLELPEKPVMRNVSGIDGYADGEDEQAIVEAAIEKVATLVRCDRDEAVEYLAQRIDDSELDTEVMWQVQVIAAQCMIDIGFGGAMMHDEFNFNTIVLPMTAELLATMRDVEEAE